MSSFKELLNIVENTPEIEDQLLKWNLEICRKMDPITEFGLIKFMIQFSYMSCPNPEWKEEYYNELIQVVMDLKK